MLRVLDLFLWLEKNMAALSELLLQMVMCFHASSHVKPWRVKMRMQMRTGRKEHKNNRHRHSGCFYSCIGHKLIRGDAAVSLKWGKRWELLNTKRRCWLVIVGFCSQEVVIFFFRLKNSSCTLQFMVFELISNIFLTFSIQKILM